MSEVRQIMTDDPELSALVEPLPKVFEQESSELIQAISLLTIIPQGSEDVQS
jgi:hypothetical protein